MFFSLLFSNNYEFYEAVILFAACAAGLIFSLVLHEIGHGVAALVSGDPTAKYNGRLSLNPLKHLDPIGFLMLVVVGFGYAKPVPVNPRNFKKPRMGLFLVSIAGVTVNIVLAFLLSGIYFILLRFAPFSVFYDILITVAYFNIFLCFFNLLPIFPLDGFHLIESICKRENAFLRFMRSYSMYILILLIGLNIIVGRFAVDLPWWQYVDILGTYLGFFSSAVMNGFAWFWGLFL